VFGYLAHRGLANFPLQDIIPDSSANGVTSYLVLIQANYCIVSFARYRRTCLPTALATLVICIIGFGRGSILSAAAIVALGAAAQVWSGGRARALAVAVLLLLGSLYVAVRYGEEIATFVNSSTKIGSGLFDVHRYGMISEYLSKVDAATVWTGASYTGTSIVSEYNGNPHNSFIRAHYIFGLPYLLLVILMPIYLMNRAHPPLVKLYAGMLWMVVLFRSFTEPVLFPTLFDFFYFAVCFTISQRPAAEAQQAVAV
jgi:hypothetical protein